MFFKFIDYGLVFDITLGPGPCAGIIDGGPCFVVIVVLVRGVKAANLIITESCFSPKLGVGLKSRPAVIYISDAKAYRFPKCRVHFVSGLQQSGKPFCGPE
jgi:hypothetical protein